MTAVRWILLIAVTLFVTGCYAPARRAGSCATCNKSSRPASRATTIR